MQKRSIDKGHPCLTPLFIGVNPVVQSLQVYIELQPEYKFLIREHERSSNPFCWSTPKMCSIGILPKASVRSRNATWTFSNSSSKIRRILLCSAQPSEGPVPFWNDEVKSLSINQDSNWLQRQEVNSLAMHSRRAIGRQELTLWYAPVLPGLGIMIVKNFLHRVGMIPASII